MYTPHLDLPVLAGIASTAIFASSTLPMLIKALRTRDLASYSLGHLTLANVGNAVHSVYVFSLPAGPLWALHTFHLVSTVFMFVWYLRFGMAQRRVQPGPDDDPTSPGHDGSPAGAVLDAYASSR